MKKTGYIIFFMVAVSFFTKNTCAEELVIERFSQTEKKNTLKGWKLLKKKGKPDFTVVEEDGNYVLRLRSKKSSFRLEKRVEIDYNKYPIASWRWKVVKLPEGGDVCNRKTDDQAAQIYFCFSQHSSGWLRNKLTTNLLGYIWENLTPALTTQISRSWPKIRYYVLHNGKEKQKIGRWVTERINVAKDYTNFFGDKVPEHLFGIALMIDSDDTASSAECYFDDIVFQSH